MRRRILLICLVNLFLVFWAKSVFAEFATEPDIFIPVINPYRFTIGDLNNDRLPDVVTEEASGLGNYQASIFYQKKNNSFGSTPDKVLLAGKKVYGVGIYDMDKDKLSDLVVTVENDGFYLFYQKEQFSTEHKYSRKTIYTNSELAIGDVTGNGLPDLVTNGCWMRNEGNGVFKNGYFEISCYQGYGKNDNRGPLLEDMDGDGHLDVLFRGPKEIRIYPGPIESINVRPQDLIDFTRLFSEEGTAYMTIGDFNGDGRLDIATVPWSSPNKNPHLSIFYQNSPLGFTEGAKPSYQIELNQQPGPIAAGDLNGDGLDDLVAARYYYLKNQIYIFYQKKGMKKAGLEDSFTEADLTLHARGNGVYWVEVVDMNNDGLLDIVASSTYPKDKGGISVFLNKKGAEKAN